jgi:hypothetical protein
MTGIAMGMGVADQATLALVAVPLALAEALGLAVVAVQLAWIPPAPALARAPARWV